MSELTQETLFTSARAQFLKYGIKSVSMDDLARLLGISKKTIYNFISNKKGLVHAVVKTYIRDEEKTMRKITKNSSNAIDEIIQIASHVQGTLKSMKPSLTYDLKKYHPNTWQLIEGKHFSFIEKSVEDNLKRGIKEGYYREDIRVDIVPTLYISLAKLVANPDLFEHQNINHVDLYDSVISYHLNALINNNGRKELAKYLKLESK